MTTPNPNTHPEQIVDKNGKVTTVYKSNDGAKQPATTVRVGTVKAPPKKPHYQLAPELVDGYLERLRKQDKNVLAGALNLREQLGDIIHHLSMSYIQGDIERVDPKIAAVEVDLYFDNDGYWKIKGLSARDGEGDEVTSEDGELTKQLGNIIYGYGITSLFPNAEQGESVLRLDDDSYEDYGAYPAEVLDVVDRNYELLSLDGFRAIDNELAKSVQKEATAVLATELHAIDPRIEGIVYSASQSRTSGGWNVTPDTILIDGKNVDLYNGGVLSDDDADVVDDIISGGLLELAAPGSDSPGVKVLYLK